MTKEKAQEVKNITDALTAIEEALGKLEEANEAGCYIHIPAILKENIEILLKGIKLNYERKLEEL